MFYWFLKWIAIGPLLRVVFRPRVSGSENVPEEGPAILASNHLSYADGQFLPLTLTRRVTFVAKAEYFTTPGIKGWFQKQFFSGAGQVPIDRSSGSAAEGALSSAKQVLAPGAHGGGRAGEAVAEKDPDAATVRRCRALDRPGVHGGGHAHGNSRVVRDRTRRCIVSRGADRG